MRQANSTIRGYLYQFNKSIFEILSAKEEDSITLEGVIEDIDIQNPTNITTIQCKYHEDKKFQISSIAEPILEMLCHYHECCAIGKSMSYILFAYYSDNVDSIDKNKFKEYIQSTTNKEILLAYFHRIYTIQDPRILQIANKNKKTTDEKNQIIDYYTKNRTALNLCVSLDDFWEHFTYHKAEQYDILSQKIIDKLSELADKETAENLYYPNAFSYISNLSSKPDVSQRTVTKKQLLDFLLTQKSILLSQWALEALDKAKILKKKKTHLSSYFSSNTDVRAFIFSDKFNELNSDSLITFIHAYINKYYKKPKLQKPPIFIFGNKSEDLFQNIVSELFKYQKYVNVGMVGNSFIAENFINNITYTNQVSCKMALLKNITIDLLEKCNVNQLYIMGNILEDFSNCNYIIENIDIEEVQALKYLVGLEKTLED